MPTAFRVSRSLVDGVPTLAVVGDVDVSTSEILDRHLHEALAEGHPTVVVDMSEVDFFDSSGARVLLEADRPEGPRVQVKEAPEKVERVFRLLSPRPQVRLGPVF